MQVHNRDYKTFLYYSDSDNINEIPESPGNYYFVHYINIPPSFGIEKSWKLLKQFSSIDFDNSEEGRGQKYFYKVRELSFRDYNPSSVLGLSHARESKLYEHLSSSNKILEKFLTYYKELCFTRPFYIGKAINLRSRINQHLKGSNSPILEQIENRSIDKDNIWVSYDIIEQDSLDILNIYEEISQKFLKPSITEKFG